MNTKICSTGLRWIWVTLVVIGFDRVSKVLAQKYLAFHEALPVMPFFNFTLSYNKGAAFSFLDSASGWQTWMFGSIATAVSVGMLIWLYRLPATQKWLSIAIALIIGGAIGNLWDRIAYGHVVDFIDWYISSLHWPVFNIADSAVFIGAIMLFIDALKKKN